MNVIKKTIYVAMSGGVDSSVAAALLNKATPNNFKKLFGHPTPEGFRAKTLFKFARPEGFRAKTLFKFARPEGFRAKTLFKFARPEGFRAKTLFKFARPEGFRANNFFKKPVIFLKEHKFIFLTSAILLIAVISLSQSQDLTAGIKRIIYFINLSLVGIIIYDLIARKKVTAERIVKNIAIPTVTVAIIGFIQLAMSYLMDIYQFMRIWGEGIECRLFGNEWCYIASWVGNTWFAYFGDQLSLRMFSIFP